MLKIIAAILLMAGIAQARPATFDDWWFAGSFITYSDMVLSSATNFSLSSSVGYNITRNQGGTLNVTNNGYSFHVGSTHSNINGILPWATIMDTAQPYTHNWAVYNGASNALSSFTDYNTSGGGGANVHDKWGAATNARPPSGQSRFQGAGSVNSIVFDNGAWLNPFGGTKTCTMQGAAAILQAGGTSYVAVEFNVRSIRFDFGSREALFHILGTFGHESYSGETATMMTGSGGVTKSGAGTLVFGYDGAYSGLRSYNMGNTGTFTINEGTVRAQSTHANALGAGSLQINGGIIDMRSNANLDYARPVTVNANCEFISGIYSNGAAGATYTLSSLLIGSQTLTISAGTNVSSGTAGVTFSGATELLTGSPTFNVTTNGSAGTTLTLAGVVTDFGSGYGITKTGAGQLTLSGSNSYANTYVNAGTLSVQNNNALPSSYNLYVTNSAVANLGSITNTINKLFLGGTEQNTGTHGSSSSTATFQNDTYFTGAGVLSVTNGL